jgi:hypothetical protein
MVVDVMTLPVVVLVQWLSLSNVAIYDPGKQARIVYGAYRFVVP